MLAYPSRRQYPSKTLIQQAGRSAPAPPGDLNASPISEGSERRYPHVRLRYPSPSVLDRQHPIRSTPRAEGGRATL